KQMRQRLKSRMKPRGRPHLKQRRTVREENFGLRFALTIMDFFAIGMVAPKECFEACTLPYGDGLWTPDSWPRFWQFPLRDLLNIRPPTRLGHYTRGGGRSQTWRSLAPKGGGCYKGARLYCCLSLRRGQHGTGKEYSLLLVLREVATRG